MDIKDIKERKNLPGVLYGWADRESDYGTQGITARRGLEAGLLQ